MAFTRFYDDPCRIQKHLEESTSIGNYFLNPPGNGLAPYFVNDPHIRMQKWGANLSNNLTNLESDLLKITRKLNKDTIKENTYSNDLNNNYYNQNSYPVFSDELTWQSRVTNPAYELRELNYNTKPDTPNNFNYLHLNPQEHICIPFHNNISSRIVEKDYYNINNEK